MKTTIAAVMMVASVLFLGFMVRMQHETFAARAARGGLLSGAAASSPPPRSAPPAAIGAASAPTIRRGGA